eukprot:CAMPEP_0185169584 /NCGR_PEP_ID=MMETSP1139-20130426/17450_1 /TAXON_ID=298111 /ORGANISM="Pavlova sp., Strain CCMP459" /LENGTH=149 /DNA_ID=CAMNT_0027735123 /DNA_START=426 /DNA_END=876 /DNA_ORIENTATION=-
MSEAIVEEVARQSLHRRVTCPSKGGRFCVSLVVAADHDARVDHDDADAHLLVASIAEKGKLVLAALLERITMYLVPLMRRPASGLTPVLAKATRSRTSLTSTGLLLPSSSRSVVLYDLRPRLSLLAQSSSLRPTIMPPPQPPPSSCVST